MIPCKNFPTGCQEQICRVNPAGLNSPYCYSCSEKVIKNGQQTPLRVGFELECYTHVLVCSDKHAELWVDFTLGLYDVSLRSQSGELIDFELKMLSETMADNRWCVEYITSPVENEHALEVYNALAIIQRAITGLVSNSKDKRIVIPALDLSRSPEIRGNPIFLRVSKKVYSYRDGIVLSIDTKKDDDAKQHLQINFSFARVAEDLSHTEIIPIDNALLRKLQTIFFTHERVYMPYQTMLVNQKKQGELFYDVYTKQRRPQLDELARQCGEFLPKSMPGEPGFITKLYWLGFFHLRAEIDSKNLCVIRRPGYPPWITKNCENYADKDIVPLYERGVDSLFNEREVACLYFAIDQYRFQYNHSSDKVLYFDRLMGFIAEQQCHDRHVDYPKLAAEIVLEARLAITGFDWDKTRAVLKALCEI
jgi:hypothetical protein